VFGLLIVEDREREEMEEEEGVGLPVMLNCWDWARMATPVGFCWTKLIWKPWPVGQPDEGAFTVAEPGEVETSCFKTMLVFGYTTMFTKEIVKLVGSVETEFHATFWVFWVASQKAPSTGLVTERPRAVATNKRAAESTEKARIVELERTGSKGGAGSCKGSCLKGMGCCY